MKIYDVPSVIETLVANGLVTKEDVAACAPISEKTVLDRLLERAIVTEDQVLDVVAAEYGYRRMNLDTEFDSEEGLVAFKLVSGHVARLYEIFPVETLPGRTSPDQKACKRLLVAFSDPTNAKILDELRYILQTEVEGIVVSQSQIDKFIKKYYGTACLKKESSSPETRFVEKSSDQIQDSIARYCEHSKEQAETCKPISDESMAILRRMRPGCSDEQLRDEFQGEFPDYVKEAWRKDLASFAVDRKKVDYSELLPPSAVSGAELILAERQRQLDSEGWTPDHDTQWVGGELVDAAICYAEKANGYISDDPKYIPMSWPWDDKWWKPKDKIRDLVRAGALIAAEIDRLQRIEKKNK